MFSLVGLVLACGLAAPPAQAISIDFVPSSQSVLLGPAEVALRISGLGDLAAPSLGTFDFDVSFDPALLSFIGVTFGDPLLGDQLDLFGLGSFIATTPGVGVVNLLELSLDSAADLNALQAGEFTLATLSFGTLAAGTSPLILAINALGDADGNSLAASIGAGSVTIQSAAVPEPSTLWLFLASGLAGLTLVRIASLRSGSARRHNRILNWLNWRETIQAVADVRRETRGWARDFTGEGRAAVSRNRRGMSAELAGVESEGSTTAREPSGSRSKKVRRPVCAALFLVAGSVLATPALGQAPGFPEVKLTASDRAASDQFGVSVALSGDTALVGAFRDDSRAGSAYVFVRNGTTWTQQVKLTASDRAANDFFGVSVALSGDTALVGAYGDDSNAGSAYVFVRNATTWTQQAKLTASDRAASTDQFGVSVALSGDTALVGAFNNDSVNNASGAGSAYVFVRNGTTWTQQAKLTASDRASPDVFGRSVALSGDTALVGAINDDSQTGSAYVFVRNGTTWTQQAKLTASDRAAFDRFGSSVALSGDTALVGAVGENDSFAGSAYVFVRNGTTWTQQAKLTASDRASPDEFGVSVALSGDTALVGAYGDDSGTGSAYVYTLRPRRPVLIIPGVGATYSADVNNDLPWLINRGVDPALLQIDPLARTYHDLIQTLKNVGYVEGKDLFVVNYDWRLPPGPDDGFIDGQISGLTAASISARSYLYAVDYLGDILREIAENWDRLNPGQPPLDAVDVITHSTGGLVARTYIQSAAYGGAYSGTKTLPKINSLIMIAVPNRGASKAWNPLDDNWVVDPAFQLVLSKIINRAYQKVLNGVVISGPDYNISLASISPPNCLDFSEVCFINQYVPTARALLATYDFLNCDAGPPIPGVACGTGFTNVNGRPDLRNSLLLDLNAGLDRALVGDPNAFADKAKVNVIYGTNGGQVPAPLQLALGLVPGTPTAVLQKLGTAGGQFGFRSIAPFADFQSRDARSGEVWYDDIVAPLSGDGTVPIDSSAGQFFGDARVTLLPFTQGGNTQQSVGHTDLPFNTDVQKAILDTLGVSCPAPCSEISTGLSTAAPSAVKCAVTGCSNFTLDPVEGFVVDSLGRRLGFSAATGPVTEIPGSVWYGNTDGIGWIFGPVEEPLRLELTGLGERYYVMVSVLTPTGSSGLIDQGILGLGAQRVLAIPATTTIPNAPPVANAGADRTVRLGSVVTLNGGGSTDPDNAPAALRFAWTQTGGPAVVLTGATTTTPTFKPAVAGSYTFALIVNDGASDSPQDTVLIKVPKLGDLDLDGTINMNDLNLVNAARNTLASGPNDLRDLNGDGKIDALDARILVTLCSKPRCAP